MTDSRRLGHLYVVSAVSAPTAVSLPTAVQLPTAGWLIGQLQRASDFCRRRLATPDPQQPIATHYIGEELRAAQADLETGWRFRKRPGPLTTSLLTHGSLYAD